MTLEVRTLSAEDYAPLSFDEALAVTEDIRLSVADLELKIVTAYFGRAWAVMGYDSWDDYVQGEFKQAPLALPREDRKASVASLRSQGLSLRAIASATGVDPATVHRDLAPVANATPDSITGIDGREYPATRPTTDFVPTEGNNDTPPAQREACPTCGQFLPT